MKSYLASFSIFIIAAAAIIYLLEQSSYAAGATRWALLAYFSVLTLASHYGITRATQSRPQVFVNYYMASTTIKLLLNLGILVVYAVLNKSSAIGFIITFMVFYFAFTIFEVAWVWRLVKKN